MNDMYKRTEQMIINTEFKLGVLHSQYHEGKVDAKTFEAESERMMDTIFILQQELDSILDNDCNW